MVNRLRTFDDWDWTSPPLHTMFETCEHVSHVPHRTLICSFFSYDSSKFCQLLPMPGMRQRAPGSDFASVGLETPSAVPMVDRGIFASSG